MRLPRLALVVLACLLLAEPARATLIDLGDGTIYSTDLGMAFLQDMNTARTTGFDADGELWFEEALAWIDHLNATRHLGYNDWALAGSPIVGADFLEHLFYVELGNPRPAHGVATPFDPGPFTNVMRVAHAGYYVSSIPFGAPCERLGDCWALNYRIQEDDYDGDPWPQFATAMRFARVPEPSTLLLVGVGVGLLYRQRSRTARRHSPQAVPPATSSLRGRDRIAGSFTGASGMTRKVSAVVVLSVFAVSPATRH